MRCNLTKNLQDVTIQNHPDTDEIDNHINFRRGGNGTCLCGGVGGSGFDIVQKSHIMDGQNDDKKNEKDEEKFHQIG